MLSEPEILGGGPRARARSVEGRAEVFGSSNYHTHMVGQVAERDGRPRAKTGGALPGDAMFVAYRDPADILAAHLYHEKAPPCAAAYRPGDKLGERRGDASAAATKTCGRRCVARLAATMDAALALEDATFVDYSDLPGAIDDIAARFGLPTVNVSAPTSSVTPRVPSPASTRKRVGGLRRESRRDEARRAPRGAVAWAAPLSPSRRAK